MAILDVLTFSILLWGALVVLVLVFGYEVAILWRELYAP